MEQTNKAPSAWERFKESDFLYYFKRDKVAMSSFAVFMLFLLLAIAAPLIAPSNPYDLSSIDIMDAELPPSWMEGGDETSYWAPMSKGAIFFPPFYTVRVYR